MTEKVKKMPPPTLAEIERKEEQEMAKLVEKGYRVSRKKAGYKALLDTVDKINDGKND
jgi:hypothetical protein